MKPKCHQCVHRSPVPGDAHSACEAITAKVVGNAHGKREGWFEWPINFDPTWLESCDSHSTDPKERKEADVIDKLFAWGKQ